MDKIRSFFKVERLGDITWAHKVNSQSTLKKCCGAFDAMMIEGDISYSAEIGQIIMAHPPKQESDLTFEDWIEAVASAQKGAKLDFKDPSVVAPCLTKLQRLNRRDMPVFLNADLLQGPGGGPSKFQPQEFISQCSRYYPEGILSIGWTTGHVEEGRYSGEMVDRMLEACERAEGAITFPVRAYFVRDSWTDLQRLLENPEYTLTIWNSEVVGEDLKQWLRDTTDPDRTFYDVTDFRRSSHR